MTSDYEDPWAGIIPPHRASAASARRVDPDIRWDVFWAVDADRRCLLMLQHAKGIELPARLPRLRGLQVNSISQERDAEDLLVVRLVDREQRDLFYRLCTDVVAAIRMAATETEAVERFLARIWRWHRLLRSGLDGRLSDAEQMGLLGELKVLQDHLFPAVGVIRSVTAWSGPLGASKDFELGRVCLEVKARHGTAAGQVTISSEHQLDSSGADALFLHVLEVTRAGEEAEGSLSVMDAVEDVRRLIGERDAAAVDVYDERLLAMGLDRTDNYRDRYWVIGAEHIFEVREGFPRLAASSVPAGVSNIRYSIELGQCESFRVAPSDLARWISGGDQNDES